MYLAGTQRGRIRFVGAVGGAGAALLVAIVVTGCTSEPAAPRVTATAPSSAAAATPPTATAAPDPQLLPHGSASDTLVYFDFLAAAVTKANPAADGSAYIDALVAGGFDRNMMEVTYDRTQADLAADSIQFSVRFANECLIGQIGPASNGYHSTVAPLLATGKCLIGATRPLD